MPLGRIRLPRATASIDGSFSDYRLRNGFAGSHQRCTYDLLEARGLVCLGLHGGTCFADRPVGAPKARLTPTRYVFRGVHAFRFALFVRVPMPMRNITP